MHRSDCVPRTFWGLSAMKARRAYRTLLEDAGFIDIRCFDTTPLAAQDVASSLTRLLASREAVIAASGDEVYYGLLELWGRIPGEFHIGTPGPSRLSRAGSLDGRPIWIPI